MMKIHFTFEADSKTDSEELARLAYLFSGTTVTALEPMKAYTYDLAQDNDRATHDRLGVEYGTSEDDRADGQVVIFANTHGDTALVTSEGLVVAVNSPDAEPEVKEPVKRPRKPRGVQTPPPATAGEASGPTDLAAALDTALEAIPGVTDLTDALPVEEAPVASVEPESTPPVTIETEVTVAEDGFDLLGDAETEAQEPVITETVSLPDLPAVETMDHAAAGAEIRRLVIKNTGAWLRDILTHYKVNRISDLSLEQSHDAIRNGRVRAGEVAAA